MMALMSIKNKLDIDLIFFEKGHTQNIKNSVHSVIERGKKGVPPLQCLTLMENVSRAKPYKVTSMTQNDFLNFQMRLDRVFDPIITNNTFDSSD